MLMIYPCSVKSACPRLAFPLDRCFQSSLRAYLQEIIPASLYFFSYWALVCLPSSLEPLSLQRTVWTHRSDDAARQPLKKGMYKHTLLKGHHRILYRLTNIRITVYFSVRWSCYVKFWSALLCNSSPTFVNLQQSCQVHSDCAACQGGCVMCMQTPFHPRFFIVLFGIILHPCVA